MGFDSVKTDLMEIERYSSSLAIRRSCFHYKKVLTIICKPQTNQASSLITNKQVDYYLLYFGPIVGIMEKSEFSAKKVSILKAFDILNMFRWR